MESMFGRYACKEDIISSHVETIEDIEMKNLIKLTLVSASLAVAGIANSAETVVGGQVDEVCDLDVGSTSLDFGVNPQAGDSVNTNFSLTCNDGDGATLRVQSSEGGLESDDNEDLSIEYTADAVVGATLVSLTTTPGVGLNDEFEEESIPGSLALAAGLGGTLTVTLNDTPLFSGGYQDTISLNLTAN